MRQCDNLRTFLFCFYEHPLKCRNNHQHDCGHLRKEEVVPVSRHLSTRFAASLFPVVTVDDSCPNSKH